VEILEKCWVSEWGSQGLRFPCSRQKYSGIGAGV